MYVVGLHGCCNVVVTPVHLAEEAYQIARDISQKVIFGDSDNHLRDKISAMSKQKIRFQCGATSELAQTIFEKAGFSTRVVRVLTADEPNNFDDGHVMIEVKICDHWCLFDLSLHRYFRRHGYHISLSEFVEGGYDEVVIMADLATADDKAGRWAAANLKSIEQQRVWTKRIFQIYGYDQPSGKTIFVLPPGTESRKAWVESLSPMFSVRQ